ncbi:MAG: VCBS repeat-containing protein, partial [Planctomycetaceae bacterium]|nr:VCBS repeat-containing protein [Planctomycetaceae bacterium]
MPMRRLRIFCLLFALALTTFGCSDSKTPEVSEKTTEVPPQESIPPDHSPRSPSETDWFEDVTSQTGINATYHSGQDAKLYTILETVGGGVAMLDYDQDGDMDLFFPGGGEIHKNPAKVTGKPSRLYRNKGDWKFSDVTEEMGLDQSVDYSHGCAVSDFNRDGWPDLFLTCYGQSRLYQNQKGQSFSDVTETVGLAFSSWSTAVTWADVNRDGWPDLYVAGYVKWELDPNEICEAGEKNIRDVCPPQKYPAARDRLFLNRQGQRFEEVTDQAQLSTEGKGLGVLAADFNHDGWLDLYVANDGVANQMYLGGADFPLREVGEASGTAFNEFGAPEGSMGLDYADFNGDGRGDLFVTNFEMEDNSLYRHIEGYAFVHS